MEQTPNSQNPARSGNSFWTWFILIAIPVIILVYIALSQKANTPTPTPVALENISETEVNQPASSDMMNGEPVMMADYKDGTYSAEGDYTSPGGPEQVGLEVTLADGVITDAIFTPKAERPMSVNFQGQFASGYKEFVIGKKINEVHLTKVSGSSLTPQGFNDALDKIKAEAAL